MNRIVNDGISYLVLNSAGDVVERCHNLATAKHYARKVDRLQRMHARQTFTQQAEAFIAHQEQYFNTAL